jgi:hypothetical protein
VSGLLIWWMFGFGTGESRGLGVREGREVVFGGVWWRMGRRM